MRPSGLAAILTPNMSQDGTAYLIAIKFNQIKGPRGAADVLRVVLFDLEDRRPTACPLDLAETGRRATVHIEALRGALREQSSTVVTCEGTCCNTILDLLQRSGHNGICR